MLSPVIYLVLNGLFFTLRLSGGGGSFPRPLKAEEERKYLERCAQGDLEARNILVEHNLRLVAHIVKKYYAQTGDQDDLISIGTIGLIKGISTFKADKNVRLATYASRCIENEILMHFRAQKKLQGEVSLSDTMENGGDGNSLSLMDVIAVDDNMLEDLDTRDACRRVRQCVGECLNPGSGPSSPCATDWMTSLHGRNGRWLPGAVSAGPMCPVSKNGPWQSWNRPWTDGVLSQKDDVKMS